MCDNLILPSAECCSNKSGRRSFQPEWLTAEFELILEEILKPFDAVMGNLIAQWSYGGWLMHCCLGVIFSCRVQSVVTHGFKSNSQVKVSRQDSILGPLLLSVCINNIYSSTRQWNVLFYTDDTILYTPANQAVFRLEPRFDVLQTAFQKDTIHWLDPLKPGFRLLWKEKIYHYTVCG